MNLADDLRYALSPADFALEVLGLTLDSWQSRVVGSASKRDLLNCSRQAGKSTTAAVLGLHEALYRPNSLTLLVSPSLRQSSELFRKLVELRESLPTAPELLEDSKSAMTIQGGGRVLSLPGSEQTIRGFSGATLAVLDEASRIPDELYFSVRPMLATRQGRMILMTTPFGKRGFFWHEWSGTSPWNRVEIPASSVPRITPEFLAEEKASLGDWWYRQEYECQFLESTDSVFSHDSVLNALDDSVKPLFGDTHA